MKRPAYGAVIALPCMEKNRHRDSSVDQKWFRIKQLVKELSRENIELLVVPEYNLSHFLKAATKLLIGAMSITPDLKIITTMGTANPVGLLHNLGFQDNQIIIFQ